MCNVHRLLAQHSRCANPQTQVEALHVHSTFEYVPSQLQQHILPAGALGVVSSLDTCIVIVRWVAIPQVKG